MVNTVMAGLISGGIGSLALSTAGEAGFERERGLLLEPRTHDQALSRFVRPRQVLPAKG